MKHVLFIIAFLLASICHSQTLTVLSADDRSPVLFGNVTIQPLQYPSTVQQLLTDTNGVIIIPSILLNQSLFIMISAVGFETWKDTVVLSENSTFFLKNNHKQLDEVVVTGQYAPGSIEKAVHTVKIIDRKKIDAMGAQNLRDVLTNEMNIRLSQDNVLGSGMSLQGISGQNVKILIDGIAVTGRLNGNIDISQINMNNVARIEIVEGPMSVNYGSDALAGTINIITKKSQQEPFSVSSNNYYESNGQYNFSGRIGLKSGKNTITVSGGRNYFDGWRKTDQAFQSEQKHVADSTRYMDWKPKEQYMFTFNYIRQLMVDKHPKTELKLGYTGDYFHEEILNRGLPRLPYFETAFDDQYTTSRITNSINLTGQLNKKYYTTITAAYSQYKRIKNTYYKDLTTLAQTLTENPSDQDTSIFNTFTTRGSISTTTASIFNYEVGYDINHEKSLGLRIKDQQKQLGDYAAFGSVEYSPVRKLTLRPGVRVIYNTTYKAPLVPSIHIRYAATENSSLRFSYARGFRAPSLKELYFYFVDINHNIIGNENLKAEQSHNFNLSVLANTKTANLSWKTEGSLFYNYIEKMITLANVTNTPLEYTYFNIDKFQTLGVQAQTSLQVQQFKFSIGGAYIGRYNQFTENYDSEKFMYSPEAKCNLYYEWKKPQLTLAVFYKYTGVLPSYTLNEENEIINKTQMNDYHTADISLSKPFWKKRITVATGMKNIFNVTNVKGFASGEAHASSSNSFSVGMGRTYFIKLDFNFTSKQ